MHFVQVDKDKANDIATYCRAVDVLCKWLDCCGCLFSLPETLPAHPSVCPSGMTV